MTSVPPPPTVPAEPAAHPSPPDRPELPAGVEATPYGPPWQWFHALGAFLGTFAAATVLGGILFAISGRIDDPSPAVSIGATVLQDACFIAVPWIFAKLSSTPRPWHFGLRPPRSWKAAAGWIAVSYVGFVVFTVAWLTLIGRTDTQDDLPEQLGADESTIALIAVAILVTVMAPLAEEIFFRGFLFTALRNSWGLWPAATIVGLVFGAIHGGSSNVEFLLPLAVLGIALCLLYARTGSLYPCIALHCINNSIAFGSSQNWGWEVPLLMVAALALCAAACAAAQRWGGRGELVPPHPRLARG
jgi:hypothetical protein